MPGSSKPAPTKSKTDFLLVALAAVAVAAFVWEHGPAHGLWAAAAIFYVIALIAVVPALATRLVLNAPLGRWEIIAIVYVLAFCSYSLVTSAPLLLPFTLMGLAVGTIITLYVGYSAWRARK